MSTKARPPAPFTKAYAHIMHHPYLTPGERLVLMVVCRYWPNQCWMSNASIAYETGLSKRHVQKCLARMKNQRILYRNGRNITVAPMIIVIWDNDPYERQNYTRRWIVPTCLPGKAIIPERLQTVVRKRLNS